VILFILYSIISSSLLATGRYLKYEWREVIAVAIAWPILPALVVFSLPLALLALLRRKV
jgi:hypothetical protein